VFTGCRRGRTPCQRGAHGVHAALGRVVHRMVDEPVAQPTPRRCSRSGRSRAPPCAAAARGCTGSWSTGCCRWSPGGSARCVQRRPDHSAAGVVDQDVHPAGKEATAAASSSSPAPAGEVADVPGRLVPSRVAPGRLVLGRASLGDPAAAGSADRHGAASVASSSAARRTGPRALWASASSDAGPMRRSIRHCRRGGHDAAAEHETPGATRLGTRRPVRRQPRRAGAGRRTAGRRRGLLRQGGHPGQQRRRRSDPADAGAHRADPRATIDNNLWTTIR